MIIRLLNIAVRVAILAGLIPLLYGLAGYVVRALADAELP